MDLITDEDFMLDLGLFQENKECFTVVDITAWHWTFIILYSTHYYYDQLPIKSFT